jgi:hypothetical protein
MVRNKVASTKRGGALRFLNEGILHGVSGAKVTALPKMIASISDATLPLASLIGPVIALSSPQNRRAKDERPRTQPRVLGLHKN